MTRLSEKLAAQTRWLVLATGFLTTFIVWLPLADPINIPKMFFLTLLSAWILGIVLVAIFSSRKSKFSWGLWAAIAFIAAMLIAAVLTDVRYTAFFGTSHRNNGAISYFALATLFLAAFMSFRRSSVSQLRSAVVIAGAVTTFYGLLQTTGHDPLSWVLVYGPVIGTLGNPDFMSASLGVSAIATLWLALDTKVLWIRWGGILLLLLEIFVVGRTGSVQGLFAIAVGFVIIGVAKLWQLKRPWGFAALALSIIGSIPVLLGMVNKGPLASHIFRSSFRSRVDYWHAAFNMFKAHPIFGVGIERFGDNYGMYAPQHQVSIAQSTDNAHNVFLQLMATGGLLVILPYLFLLGVVFLTAIRAIRHSTGSAQFNLIGLFALWFGLLFISAISIDNLGVAVWFWISGGALYALSLEFLAPAEETPRAKKKVRGRAVTASSGNESYIAPLVSLLFVILILVAMVPAWKASSNLMDLQHNKSGYTKAQYIARIRQVATVWPQNSQTLIVLTDDALRVSAPDVAVEMASLALKKDPISINGNYLSATAYETLKKYDQAVPFRSKLLTLDPWSTPNMLQLVKDYVALKDLADARNVVAKISKIQPGGADATAAATLVKG